MNNQPHFPIRMSENANSYSSVSFRLYSCLCTRRLNALTECNAEWPKYVDWRKEVPFVWLNNLRPLLGGDIP